MLSKLLVARLGLCLILLGLVAAGPAFAGSAVIGSVAGSMNATVGGQALLPNTTLFSGDSLRVKDGLAVVALGSTSRLVFGRDTAASFLRDTHEVTVLLEQGDVSLYHAEDSMPVRVKMGEISVVPVAGFKTLGEVALLNGTAVITAKDGLLHVEGDGRSYNVAKGKTITVKTTSSAPQQQGGGGNPPSGKHISSLGAWEAVDTAVSAGALIFAAIDLSRTNSAKDDATSAASAAAAAASAAEAAASAAAAAVSLANYNANAIGCELDTLANEEGYASPYTPTQPCPPGT